MIIDYSIKCNCCGTIFIAKLTPLDNICNIAKFFCPRCNKLISIRFNNPTQINGGIETSEEEGLDAFKKDICVESFIISDDFKDKQNLPPQDQVIATIIQDHLPDIYLHQNRSTVSIALLKDANNTNTEIENITKLHCSITDSKYHSLNVIPNNIIKKWQKRSFSKHYIENAENIGKKLNEIIGKEIISNITKDKTQLCFFTDVPVEWIRLPECPLAFAYDVCRLPTANYQFHQQYLEDLNKKNFFITKDIFEKTYVCMCCPQDPNMASAYKKSIGCFSEVGFTNYKICHSLNEFRSFLNDKKPVFLIIDSHGNYDCDEYGDYFSFIQIGEERLTSEDVDTLSYIPPLIFLSACNTRPPIKVEQCIVDAFIRRGSLAVTASYVKLNIDQGVYTISRILNNLKSAAKMGVHRNWLSFISHCIRTFLQQTAYTNGEINFYKKKVSSFRNDLEYLKRHDEQLISLYEHIEQQLKDSMSSIDLYCQEHTLICSSVYARKYFYQQWRSLSKDEIDAEFLNYTNYGRMDLIPFESYIEAAQKKCTTPSDLRKQIVQKLNDFDPEKMKIPNINEQTKDNLCWCGSGRKFINCHGQKK